MGQNETVIDGRSTDEAPADASATDVRTDIRGDSARNETVHSVAPTWRQGRGFSYGALMPYVAVIRKAPDTDFSVDFPDLPGCMTAGRTMQEARRLAAAALAFHLAGMIADGLPLPAPRSLGAIRDDPKCADAKTLILVEAPAKSD